MRLSILICSIPERAHLLSGLLEELDHQIAGRDVEILVDKRPKPNKPGGISVGVKRQSLLERAAGRYVCFHDDDDMPAPDYVSSILEAMADGPDGIGFILRCHFKEGIVASAHSSRYGWDENVDGYRYVRSLNHLNPVKREIALSVGFPDKPLGEDYAYSLGLVGKIKSEVFIPRFLYEYLYCEEDRKTKYGLTNKEEEKIRSDERKSRAQLRHQRRMVP